MSRKAFRFPLNIAMALLLPWMMSYPVTRGLLRHGVCGCLLLALFLFHHFLNVPFWVLPWRSQTKRHALLLVADILLLFDLLALIMSSLVMAGEVFSFAPFAMPWWGRGMHSAAASWCFVLSFFHLGLHGQFFWSSLHAFGKRILGRAWMTVVFSVFLTGAVFFLKSGLPNSMFFLEEVYVYPNLLLLSVSLFMIALFFSLLGRGLWILAAKNTHTS